MADYIPGPDSQFDAWQQNFITYANANLAGLGLVADYPAHTGTS